MIIIESKKIVLVSHCVLNQNSVIKGWARARGAFPFVNSIINSGHGIISIPCPEIRFGGINRPPLEYEDYNTNDYRALCKKIADNVRDDILIYVNDGYTFSGIIGINNSPTCSITGTRGVLMEEIFSSLNKVNIIPKILEVPESYSENSYDLDFENKLNAFLK